MIEAAQLEVKTKCPLLPSTTGQNHPAVAEELSPTQTGSLTLKKTTSSGQKVNFSVDGSCPIDPSLTVGSRDYINIARVQAKDKMWLKDLSPLVSSDGSDASWQDLLFSLSGEQPWRICWWNPPPTSQPQGPTVAAYQSNKCNLSASWQWMEN